MFIEDDADWGEVSELLTASYRALAPSKLVKLIDDAWSRSRASTSMAPICRCPPG